MKNLKSVSKISLVAFGLLVAVMPLHAQPQEVSYRAYVTNSLGLWEQAINKSADNSLDKALAYHGYLSATMADRDENAFDKYYDHAIDLLENLESDSQHEAKAKALLSSAYGLSIAYDGWKGMFLGSKSSSLVSDAYAAAPEDPMVLKMYAGNKLYTPETFGGDPQVAYESCLKSIKIYENQGDTIQNWIYLDALALLGMMQQKSGHLDASIATYEKALALEPDYGWVKYALLPSAKKAKQSK